MDKLIFKHSIPQTVRFHEVDMMNVVNNAVYFNYFEDARIAYVRNLKAKYGLKELLENGSWFIMAHNNCDYIEPALMDDELLVYTRVSFIKNSSFGFEHIIEKKKTGRIIAKGGGVVVHINLESNKSVPLPEEFYTAVQEFEDNVEILQRK